MKGPFPNDENGRKRQALLTLGIIENIRRLVRMDQPTFIATQEKWTEHRWDDPAWSEAISFFVRPGLSQAAFVSVCEKVAVLAFCPGGVDIFGLSFEAKRDMDWLGWLTLEMMYVEAYVLMAADIEAVQAAPAQESQSGGAKNPEKPTKKKSSKKR